MTLPLVWSIGFTPIIALTNKGLLTPARGPAIDGSNKTLYARAEVERFIALVLKCSEGTADYTSNNVQLTRFRPVATWNLNDTIEAILDGSLKPVDTGTQEPLFHRLILPCEEVNRFLEERTRRCRVDQKLFTVEEAAARFGVGTRALKCWINQGLIAAERIPSVRKRSHLFITQKSLEAFCMTYILATEVVELLGVTPQTLKRYVSRGKLHSVGGYGKKWLFLRKEVEALKSRNPDPTAKRKAE